LKILWLVVDMWLHLWKINVKILIDIHLQNGNKQSNGVGSLKSMVMGLSFYGLPLKDTMWLLLLHLEKIWNDNLTNNLQRTKRPKIIHPIVYVGAWNDWVCDFWWIFWQWKRHSGPPLHILTLFFLHGVCKKCLLIFLCFE